MSTEITSPPHGGITEIKQPLSHEEIAELNSIGCMSSTKSAGLETLTAVAIGNPLGAYSREVSPIPGALVDLDDYVRGFIEWYVETLKGRKGKDAAKKLTLWSGPEAETDVRLYILRAIWKVKSETGAVRNPAAAIVSAVRMATNDWRSTAHKAVSHVRKHSSEDGDTVREYHDSIKAAMEEALEPLLLKLTNAAMTQDPRAIEWMRLQMSRAGTETPKLEADPE